jgi:riboflavin kinase/FMN adenylyltransferase
VRVWRGGVAGPGAAADAPAADLGRCVVTIGVFDGVHLGHQRIVSRALARAAELRLPVVAVTFDPIPEAVVSPDDAPALLTLVDRRLELLAGLGVDATYVIDFTPQFAELSAEEFVRLVLVERLRAVDVIVGENFRFGHRAAGNVDTLRALGGSVGFMVDTISLAHPAGAHTPAFSSTWIRARIAEGDVAGAASALGRPHRLEGVVVHGDHRGRALGYRTANLDVPPALAVPADGVYAGRLDGMPAAISIGTNPTFDGTSRRVEAYAIDRTDLELYGKYMTLDVVARLRGMVAFAGVEELVAQMADDVARARALV